MRLQSWVKAAAVTALFVLPTGTGGQAGLNSPVVFVSRAIPRPGHIADGQNRTGSLPGIGSVSRFTVANPGKLLIRETNGVIRTLVDGSSPTSQSLDLIDVHAPDVSYNGQTIVFAGLRNGTYSSGDRRTGAHPGAWRIYTINVDGTGIRQVTPEPPALDLSQFPFNAANFNKADDTDPVWLPDGRIVFSSTRWPAIAQYRDPRTTNLYVVNANGTGLHRITAERNGADRPMIDPTNGRVVYSRWWRNGHPPSDNMTTKTDPVYGGYLLRIGLATDDSGRYTEAEYASLGAAYERANRNLWISATVNPDGTDLKLWNGSFDDDPMVNSLYGGTFDEQGNIYSNLIPLENLAEVAGFGGIRYHRRGLRAPSALPTPILGVTEFLPNLPRVYEDLERVYVSEYAAEPEVVPGSSQMIVSIAPNANQDYGLYLINRDGSGRQLLYDGLGTTEIRARLVRARPLPPVIADGPTLQGEVASLLPPRANGPYDGDGTFVFDALNIYFNAPVDSDIPHALPVGSAASIRFFADFIYDSPTTNTRYNWPISLGERAVAADGAVQENAPANIPLFEQIRTAASQGYKVPITSPSGAGHVAGMNFGRPGTRARCVGCHQGHTLIAVPPTDEAARWTNLATGAQVTASSSASSPNTLVNRKVLTESTGSNWKSASGQNPLTQWVKLTFPVPINVRTVRLYDPRSTLSVRNATVRLFSDVAETVQVGQADSGQVADAGTDVAFLDALARVVRVDFRDVVGTQASLAEIEVIAKGATPGPPPAAPTNVRIQPIGQ